jgi:hypothetical protein
MKSCFCSCLGSAGTRPAPLVLLWNVCRLRWLILLPKKRSSVSRVRSVIWATCQIRGGYTDAVFLSDDVACKLVNFTQTASTFVAKVGMYHRKTNKCASKLTKWQTKGQSHTCSKPCTLGKTTTPRSLCCFRKTHCASKPLDEIIQNVKNTQSHHITKKHIVELSTLTTQLKMNLTTFFFISSLSSC